MAGVIDFRKLAEIACKQWWFCCGYTGTGWHSSLNCKTSSLTPETNGMATGTGKNRCLFNSVRTYPAISKGLCGTNIRLVCSRETHWLKCGKSFCEPTVSTSTHKTLVKNFIKVLTHKTLVNNFIKVLTWWLCRCSDKVKR